MSTNPVHQSSLPVQSIRPVLSTSLVHHAGPPVWFSNCRLPFYILNENATVVNLTSISIHSLQSVVTSLMTVYWMSYYTVCDDLPLPDCAVTVYDYFSGSVTFECESGCVPSGLNSPLVCNPETKRFEGENTFRCSPGKCWVYLLKLHITR